MLVRTLESVLSPSIQHLSVLSPSIQHTSVLNASTQRTSVLSLSPAFAERMEAPAGRKDGGVNCQCPADTLTSNGPACVPSPEALVRGLSQGEVSRLCGAAGDREGRLRTWGYFHFFALVIMSVLSGCDPQVEDGIPYAFVEIDLNLSQSDYLDLRRDGGFVYILGGVRGIIIYRENQDRYWAFERNSPVNPSESREICNY